MKTLLVLLVALIVTTIVYFYRDLFLKPTVLPTTRVIRYTLTVRNKSADLINDANIEFFSPTNETTLQRVTKTEVSREFTTSRDQFGNETISVKLTLPPYGTEIVSVQSLVEFRKVPLEVALENEKQFLSDEKYIEVGAPAIKEAAASLMKNNPTDSAKAITEFVIKTVEENGYIRDNHGALYALNEKKGDCTEFAYLFTALARANGIPARPVGGFYLSEERAKLKGGYYHNWAEFYDGQTWQIADPLHKQFLMAPGDYLVFRRANFPENSQRFVNVDERLEVSVN